MVHADVGLPRVADVGDIFDVLIRPSFAGFGITDERFQDGTFAQGVFVRRTDVPAIDRISTVSSPVFTDSS